MRNPRYNCFKIASAGLGLALAGSAHAAVTLAGPATGYHSTDSNWLSNTANDIDGDTGLGTDGFIFFGDFDGMFEGNVNPNNDGAATRATNNNIGNAGGGNTAGLFTATLPTYVTRASTVGPNSGNVGQFAGYEFIDSPVNPQMERTKVAGNLLVTGVGCCCGIRSRWTSC